MVKPGPRPPEVMRYLTGGRRTPREEIRDQITMTVNTASRRVLEKCGLTPVRTTPYEGTDIIEGAEHGEVEYALTKPAWETRTHGDTLN